MEKSVKNSKADFSNLWKIITKTSVSEYRNRFEDVEGTKIEWNIPLHSKLILEEDNRVIVELTNVSQITRGRK